MSAIFRTQADILPRVTDMGTPLVSGEEREDSVVSEYTAEIEKLLDACLIPALCGSQHMEIDEWREERLTSPLCFVLNLLIVKFSSRFPPSGHGGRETHLQKASRHSRLENGSSAGAGRATVWPVGSRTKRLHGENAWLTWGGEPVRVLKHEWQVDGGCA